MKLQVGIGEIWVIIMGREELLRAQGQARIDSISFYRVSTTLPANQCEGRRKASTQGNVYPMIAKFWRMRKITVPYLY